MKVLLVDDSRSEREHLTAVLEDMTQKVVAAENGREAVKVFAAERPDLVLMDVNMPVMDGHEAARRIRALDIDWVPIVFLSAMARPADVYRGIESGGDDYLIKPVENIVLRAKLKAMQRIAAMRARLVMALGDAERAEGAAKENEKALEEAYMKIAQLTVDSVGGIVPEEAVASAGDGAFASPDAGAADQQIHCAAMRETLGSLSGHLTVLDDRFGRFMHFVGAVQMLIDSLPPSALAGTRLSGLLRAQDLGASKEDILKLLGQSREELARCQGLVGNASADEEEAGQETAPS